MKQLIRFFLLLLALLQAPTVTADVFEVDGIYYYIHGNNAYVTYKGMDYSDYDEYAGSVTIPSTVFYNGVTYSVTAIDYGAFGACGSLTSIVIPNSVTTIGDWAFSGCSSLTSIDIPNSVTSIGEEAFSFCIGLTSITIPNSVTNIGDRAFYWCNGLTSVTIPNSVTSIGSFAFWNCSGLTSIDIPNSVTSIGGSAFYGCSGLTNITVESGNPEYDSRNNCNAIIETASNKLITGCKNTVIPNSVTSIGGSAFSDCSGLTSIDIPNSVTSIGGSAFSYCDSLNDVYSYITDPTVITMGSGVFYREPNNYGARTLHVPAGSVAAYQADTKWSQYFGSIVEMDPVLATLIELNQSNAEITEGETLQLTATVLPEDATDKSVTWSTSDETIATVDQNGLVMAVAPGTATITATTNDGSNLSASCYVTVLQEIVLAESIQLNVTTAGLNEGATLQLTATVMPEDCADKTVLWSSDNPSVATVDSNGLVTTHSVGTATITAMTTDGSNLSTSCTVTLLPVGVKGDVNGDNSISITDVTKLIDYLLSGSWN